MRNRLIYPLLSLCLALALAACSVPAEVNEACGGNDECADNICHGGICASTSPVDTGQECSGNGDCKSYNCQSGKCAAGVAAADDKCRDNTECTSNNCNSGKCTLKLAGAACAGDSECVDGICYDKKCTKKCTKPDDCAAKQDCASDDGKRVFCVDRKYKADMGKSCAVSTTCSGGLKCYGSKWDINSVCSGECKNDLDCPPSLECSKGLDDKSVCLARKFCSACLHDGNCPTGQSCVSYGGGKWCSKPCNAGKTECPMFAECKAIGSKHYCQHKAGKCKGDGKLCSPCSSSSDCAAGGGCLSFNLTEESFCGTDCGSKSCPSGYKCYTVTSGGKKQCGPTGATSKEMPTCTKKLTFPMMEVGDIMDDFAMVGLADSNGDYSLVDETLKIVKLSDYRDKKIILFNISAFW